jgi:hypothetical protein
MHGEEDLASRSGPQGHFDSSGPAQLYDDSIEFFKITFLIENNKK